MSAFALIDPLAILFFAILGLVFGSFGNVLIVRFPFTEGIGGRSKCVSCKVIIPGWHLIPLVSYAVLRGRCASCQVRISLQYPLIETLSAVLFLVALLHTGGDVVSGILLGLCMWLLLIIAVIDAKTQLIPDALNVPLIILGLATAQSLGSVSILAPVIAVGFFGFQWIISKGMWIGSGDIILSLGVGLLLGSWKLTLVWLLLTYVIGSCITLALLVSGTKTMRDTIPFGPFLAVSAIVTLLLGEEILRVVGM